ncbi:hypothetical protein BDV27DRAFT_152909 [Aspergillus caelatus]|uniref:NAD-dependent epimerase/dehydratase domain-containing protein n=1 Tax=Aspergillus caelatus TaxID=61420 RepID=A0A5N7AKV1_9EURO|nr:uncharacterized protein BDV27DRAFT_152909 [Aspergillus caelatus]KAE8369619.1 hypothetical protein BDV27DRAFT_152909 [Aspergillus caelatus]
MAKVALATGGVSGIGLAVCKSLATQASQIAVVDETPYRGEYHRIAEWHICPRERHRL